MQLMSQTSTDGCSLCLMHQLMDATYV